MAAPLLPTEAQTLADLIGLDAALRVCEAVGGLRFSVPLTMPAKHPIRIRLADIVGEAAADKIAEYYAGGEFEPPKCEAWFKAKVRNAVILQGGKPINQIAADARLTRRRVFQIRAQAAQVDTRIADLFE